MTGVFILGHKNLLSWKVPPSPHCVEFASNYLREAKEMRKWIRDYLRILSTSWTENYLFWSFVEIKLWTLRWVCATWGTWADIWVCSQRVGVHQIANFNFFSCWREFSFPERAEKIKRRRVSMTLMKMGTAPFTMWWWSDTRTNRLYWKLWSSMELTWTWAQHVVMDWQQCIWQWRYVYRWFCHAFLCMEATWYMVRTRLVSPYIVLYCRGVGGHHEVDSTAVQWGHNCTGV